jgi:hypothetical protein
LKAPAGGFEDQKLSALFFPPTPTGSTATSTSTSSQLPQSKKRNNGGMIAGGVIGGLVILGLIAALAYFLVLRKRPQPAQATHDTEKKQSELFESRHELHTHEYAELESKHFNELPTTIVHHELPAHEHSVEMDAK